MSSQSNPTSSTSNRVIGYVRVSTDGQADDGCSLDAQRLRLDAYSVARGLDLVGVEVDAGASAKTLDRPGLSRALARLGGGEADGLLVAKLDRLTRSVRDLGYLVEPERFGSRWALLSVEDSLDTRSANGRLVLHILASVSQWEREAIGERTRDALAHLRSEGVALGAEPLGMTSSRDAQGRRVFVAEPTGAAVVERIRELRAGGASLRSIAATLTSEGRSTKRGGRWAPQTVRAVLRRLDAE